MKIGTDPEYILFNNNNQCVPAVGLLGHTKDDPLPVPGGAVLEDGVSVELNVEPATTAEAFVHNINKVKSHADGIFSNFGLTLKPIASAVFKEEDLQTPQAQESGCDPDFCIYNKKNYEPNVYPNLSETNVRYAGGHIHIEDYQSVNDPHFMERFITFLDLCISAPLNYIKMDKHRLKIYGRPGTYRPKPYGLEYRSPDNIWLTSDNTIKWVFNQVHMANTLARQRRGNHLAEMLNNAILSGDKSTIYTILREFNIDIPENLL
jgi:hypothetical protein